MAGLTKVYIGNLDARVSERELEDEFMKFGTLRSVWVARKPPGFAFIEFQDPRDADDACRDIDGPTAASFQYFCVPSNARLSNLATHRHRHAPLRPCEQA